MHFKKQEMLIDNPIMATKQHTLCNSISNQKRSKSQIPSGILTYDLWTYNQMPLSGKGKYFFIISYLRLAERNCASIKLKTAHLGPWFCNLKKMFFKKEDPFSIYVSQNQSHTLACQSLPRSSTNFVAQSQRIEEKFKFLVGCWTHGGPKSLL